MPEYTHDCTRVKRATGRPQAPCCEPCHLTTKLKPSVFRGYEVTVCCVVRVNHPREIRLLPDGADDE